MRKSISIALLLAIVAIPNFSNAGTEHEGIYLDQNTVEKGFPAKSEDNILTVSIPPHLLRKPARISITDVTENINIPPQATALTPIYDIRLHRNGKALILDKFLTLLFETPDTKKYTSIYIWNNPTQEWLRFASKKRGDTQITARMDFAEVRAVVFESADNNQLPAHIVMKQPEKVFREGDKKVLGVKTVAPPEIFDVVEVAPFAEQRGITITPQIPPKESLTVSNGDANTKAVSSDRVFSVTIPESAVSAPVIASIKIVPNNYGPPAYRKFISEIYELNLTSFDGSQVTLLKPLEISFAMDRMVAAQRKITFFNKGVGWDPLPTVADSDTLTLNAPLPLPFARIALFESTIIDEGKASWFPDKLTTKAKLGAASNDYPFGTMLTVTNTDNDKTVDVKVISTGPFVPGRIIDLTYSAFSELASPRAGVLNVRVEKKQ